MSYEEALTKLENGELSLEEMVELTKQLLKVVIRLNTYIESLKKG